jgi:predicted HTH transcriptional regulator
VDIVWQAEDNLREKKVESDLKDLLKTIVAFANSVAPGDTAQIFIGEMDDGTVQGVKSSDNIQKAIQSACDKIHPEIYYRTEVYERDGKQCVRVDIRHNGLAPHFGGPAWVRRASVTMVATEQLYQQMIDLRSSKVQQLMKWSGKTVTVSWSVGNGPNWMAHEATLAVVSASYCTFRQVAGNRDRSEPTDWLTFGWDDDNSRPRIYVDPKMINRSPW